MWEKDLLAQAEDLRKNASEEEPPPQLAQWLRQQTQRARLIAFLGRHDPLKLMQVSDILVVLGIVVAPAAAAAAVSGGDGAGSGIGVNDGDGIVDVVGVGDDVMTLTVVVAVVVG